MKHLFQAGLRGSALLLIRSQRVGEAEGIQLSNLRDSDNQFCRVAKAAITSIRDFAPWHLRRMQKSFKWIVNKRLATGVGSTSFESRWGVCLVDLHDFEDDLVTTAYLATYLVGQSVVERYQSRHLVTNSNVIEIDRRSDRIAASFAKNFNSRRDGLGDTLFDAIRSITDSERETTHAAIRSQLQFDLNRLLNKKPNKAEMATPRKPSDHFGS